MELSKKCPKAFHFQVALKLCDYDVGDFLKYYYVPILFHGFWMVMLTTLQHQDDETEVYEQGAWTFVKGQTQTIDRVYGLGIDWILHHVTDCELSTLHHPTPCRLNVEFCPHEESFRNF